MIVLVRKFGLFAILVLAFVLRTKQIFNALDYDEIWTLQYFSTRPVSAIFSELALPNNQILNSLAVKAAAALDAPDWGIRIHSLLAGLASIYLVFVISAFLFRRRSAALWSAFLLALSPAAAGYSQQARGYELQLFFLLLCAAGLVRSGIFRPKKFRYFPEIAVALGGLGSILTLPTSILFLAGMTGSALVLMKRKPALPLVCVYIAGAVFCAFWYTAHFQDFRTGQQWGTPIPTIGYFILFVKNTLSALLPPVWWLFLFCSLFLKRKKLIFALLIPAAVALGAAVLTNGGPARVYLPLVVPAALLGGGAAGPAIAKLTGKAKTLMTAGFAALLLIDFHSGIAAFTPPDWYGIHEQDASLPESVLWVRPATAGYPIIWNNPKSKEELARRLNTPSILLLRSASGILNGADDNFAEQTLKLPVKGESVADGTVYMLKELKTPAKGQAILIVSGPEDAKTEKLLWDEIAPTGSYLRLNIWFETEGGRKIRGGVAATPEKYDWKKIPSTFRLFGISEYK